MNVERPSAKRISMKPPPPMLPANGCVTAMREADRDRGVDGVAALLQHRDADVGGLRLHRDHHAVPGAHRLARRIGLDGGGDDQARERGNDGSSHATHLIESAPEAP